jgi:hypothetical protein
MDQRKTTKCHSAQTRHTETIQKFFPKNVELFPQIFVFIAVEKI